MGQAADQQISNAALSSRLVVSLAAGTEIYIVLETGAGEQRQTPPSPVNINRQSLDQLRQLLDLERELNAADALSH